MDIMEKQQQIGDIQSSFRSVKLEFTLRPGVHLPEEFRTIYENESWLGRVTLAVSNEDGSTDIEAEIRPPVDTAEYLLLSTLAELRLPFPNIAIGVVR